MTQAKRVIISLMVAVSLSFVALPAQAFATEENSVPAVQNTQAETPAQPKAVAPSPIIKKGKYLYYKQSNGKIRKKAGFVSYAGNRYYVQKGGKLAAGKTLKLKKKRYHVAKSGIVLRGAHKWGKNWYFSNASSGVIDSKMGFKNWKGQKYYVDNKGYLYAGRPFVAGNLPWVADASARCTRLAVEKYDNTVITVAQSQVGTKTGKKYWGFVYNSGFRNRDATPWCATFAAWCYNQGGMMGKIKAVKSLGYVPSYSSFAGRYGKWVNKKTAKPGDLIVFGKSTGRHIGIVERIYGGYIFTIEGNTVQPDKKSTKRLGCVARKVYKLSDKDIRGIIRP